ncbi:MAG: imidazolonepropionase [Deltaproteobacteria bacterium]|nr:imidazolonepropionase [Deltaproteobacteria bacterium]MBI3293185.1 imidazolonepropionase [Deltaproteobacteria bacterium]
MENLFIYENISQCVTMAGVAAKKGRKTVAADLGVIQDAAAVVDAAKNTFVWVGPMSELPSEYDRVVNRSPCEGELWIPELIECHTHLIYAGHRHGDYAQRVAGKSYQEIAAAGGGILSTILPTREMSRAELVEQATQDLERFQKFGVGTIEVKSGYGLTLESEIKILEAARDLAGRGAFTIVPTFMPAHAVPPEFKGRAGDYVEEIIRAWIPEVAKRKLAKFFDVFIETGFFDAEQGRRLCEAAQANGLALKLHSDQFTDIGGTGLAIDLKATSCDHLDFVSKTNISRLGESDTVAVLLPGASLFTGSQYPPARDLIDAGARVALSTDFNPGTSPTRNLPLMTTIACSQMKMTIPEALAGITYNAAAALGLEGHLGSIEPGKQFRVCNLNVSSYEAIPYVFGELGGY